MYYERGNQDFWKIFLGIFIVAIVIFVIISLVALIIQLIGMYKVYKKAGRPGWKAIIPFYNVWVLCDISGIEKWFFILMISSTIAMIFDNDYLSGLAYLASIGANFFCNYNIAKKFGKNEYGYALGLTLLPYIFFPILGFGKSKFEDVPVSKYGPISDGTVNTTKENEIVCPKCGSKVKKGIYCSACGEKIN